jgi:hypothetical protein
VLSLYTYAEGAVEYGENYKMGSFIICTFQQIDLIYYRKTKSRKMRHAKASMLVKYEKCITVVIAKSEGKRLISARMKG